MSVRDIITAAAGAAGATEANYIEDVFSTYLYTETSSSQPISNGIDLSKNDGLVWLKARSGAAGHCLFDTKRGTDNLLDTSSTGANANYGVQIAYSSTGFTAPHLLASGTTMASWTFRKQPKFFDIVTYTGTGSAQNIPHALGSTPGMILTKLVSGSDVNGTGGWGVYHRSLGATSVLELNSTAGAATDNWYNANPTSTTFQVFGNDPHSNRSGGTYVAYLFAHDAGGFGPAGTDSVVSCGSYTGNGSATGPSINLGWEPQWLLIKRTNSTSDWRMYDIMRGLGVAGIDWELYPNGSFAESGPMGRIAINQTGFQLTTSQAVMNASGGTYIYLAIRRGPMKTPTDATKVFAPVAYTGTGAGHAVTTNFPVDLTLLKGRDQASGVEVWDRLRGPSEYLLSTSTNAGGNFGAAYMTDSNVLFKLALSDGWSNYSDYTYGSWNFRRAPGFFDVVCYTGTGTAKNVSHNLGVAPELMIVKVRDSTGSWVAYLSALGNTQYLLLNAAQAANALTAMWNDTTPTSSVFTVGTHPTVNASTINYVNYLFASCPGVSKVGSYTGSGTTKQIDCGFAAGARFVLIKRTDSTGDWYTWDSSRGIVSGNDPYLLLNSTAAEVTNTDYIDPYSAGFEISSSAPAAINASGGTFIYLAIA